MSTIEIFGIRVNIEEFEKESEKISDEIRGYILEKPDEFFECSICLAKSSVSPILKLTDCNHRFHTNCIETWKRQSRTCPCCRQPLPDDIETLLAIMQNDFLSMFKERIISRMTEMFLETNQENPEEARKLAMKFVENAAVLEPIIQETQEIQENENVNVEISIGPITIEELE
jgi:hypothetical protein